MQWGVKKILQLTVLSFYFCKERESLHIPTHPYIYLKGYQCLSNFKLCCEFWWISTIYLIDITFFCIKIKKSSNNNCLYWRSFPTLKYSHLSLLLNVQQSCRKFLMCAEAEQMALSLSLRLLASLLLWRSSRYGAFSIPWPAISNGFTRGTLELPKCSLWVHNLVKCPKRFSLISPSVQLCAFYIIPRLADVIMRMRKLSGKKVAW